MAGGQGTEAPVTTLVPDRRKGNLPAEVTSFTGRRRELSQVRDALERYRLVTLRGVGGVGKTRLALHLAADLQRSFAYGVCWPTTSCGCAPCRSSRSSPGSMIASCFSARPDPATTVTRRCAAIGSSHELCTVQEQRLWARLSVFPRGFDLEAAERVCAAEPLAVGALFDTLGRLVEKSIVLCEQDGRRYRMLDTIREYGAEQLVLLGEAPVPADEISADPLTRHERRSPNWSPRASGTGRSPIGWCWPSERSI